MPAVFPVVWTALYTDVAVSSASALGRWHERGQDDEARQFAVALGANLVANASWTWLLFRQHRLGAATVTAAALAASGADLARRAARVDARAATGLGVYAGWCAFATVLSASIWRRNRGRGR